MSETSFTLQHAEGGVRIRVLAHGATWAACHVPLPGGAERSVVLGFDQHTDYQRQQAYMGATVGRWANRIAHGTYTGPDGELVHLSRHPGSEHHLHGGAEGFDQRTWTVLHAAADEVRLGLVSPAGDQGFPGTLHCEVRYRLSSPSCVEVQFTASVDAPCPVGLTNHAYFNLDGQPTDVRSHQLWLNAAAALPVDERLVPTGPPAAVIGTPLDYQTTKPIGMALDNAFLLNPASSAASATEPAEPAAELTSADGLLRLRVHTSLPALQVYTGEFLGACTAGCSTTWAPFRGVAIEPQYLPDSPNHPEWPQPSCWLMPGQTWQHHIRYEFDLPGA
ncbi:galactose-1-epimerase [Ideonella margarita]|uniref:Aldose 1-epimerase n=1 Tax=Ideonella margarita TaxID=2984191 RepID=A0ABU9C6S6_9BURK